MESEPEGDDGPKGVRTAGDAHVVRRTAHERDSDSKARAVGSRKRSASLVAYPHEQMVGVAPRLCRQGSRIALEVSVHDNVGECLTQRQPHPLDHRLVRPYLFHVGDDLVAQSRGLAGSGHFPRQETIRDHLGAIRLRPTDQRGRCDAVIRCLGWERLDSEKSRS